MRGQTIEALGPQGILAAQNSNGSDGGGDGEAAGEHWTQGFKDQYGNNAQTRQVALADVTGPGTEYLRDLGSVATGEVTYGQKAELLDVQYQEVTRQTGVLTKAIIAIATQGMGTWATFAVNTAVDGIISGEVNLGNVVKDAAFTAIGGGFKVGDVQFTGVSGYVSGQVGRLGLSGQSPFGPRAGDLLSAQSLTTDVVTATAEGGLQTVIYGGDLGDNIARNAGNYASNQLTAVGFYGAGEFKAINLAGHGSAPGVLSHVLAGCAGGSLSGAGCLEGAAAAGVNEYLSGTGMDARDVNTVNQLTAVLLSQGDPNALGQLSGITATADRYNRQLHEFEEERLAELKRGKSDEEKQRLDAAACYLIRCSAGIPKDDPEYATVVAMQKAGEGYQAEIALLRGQSHTYPPASIGGFPLAASGGTVDMFTYDRLDAWKDRHWQNGNFVRAGGILMAAGGLAESTTATVACMRGNCTVLNVATYSQGVDYTSAGMQQSWTKKPVAPLGELTLQGFGLSPEMAATIYSGTGIVAGGAAASGLRNGFLDRSVKESAEKLITKSERVTGNNARGELTSRSSFRQGTVQDAWDNAAEGPSGGRLCPSCGDEVIVPPNTGQPRDWDVSHNPSWTKREFDANTTTRQDIIDGAVLDNPNLGYHRGYEKESYQPSEARPSD